MSEITRDDLVKYCDEHGLKYHGNAGFNTLKAIVDEHKAAQSNDGEGEPEVTPASQMAPSEMAEQGGDDETAPDTDPDTDADPEPDTDPEPIAKKGEMALLNVGKNRHMIAGKVVNPGEGTVLTKKQCEDERLMAKVKTAIRCGVLEEVE